MSYDEHNNEDEFGDDFSMSMSGNGLDDEEDTDGGMDGDDLNFGEDDPENDFN